MNASSSILSSGIGDVLSDDNLNNADYGFELNVQGAATRSYLAATMTDANFAVVDWQWNDVWTVSVGGRDEYYRQVALPWNISGYSIAQPQITSDLATLQEAAFEDKGFFPAASVVYQTDWIAETFQLRLGISKTAIRPDLREVMDATYIDPATGELVYGNTDVVPASSSNVDLRADWFFDNGNSFTVSLFNKEIDKPIEFFEKAASDTNTAREIVNADSTSLFGLELEGLYGWVRSAPGAMHSLSKAMPHYRSLKPPLAPMRTRRPITFDRRLARRIMWSTSCWVTTRLGPSHGINHVQRLR